MRRSLMKVIGVVILCLPAMQRASAQSAYHQLTAADFQGVPNSKGEVVAYTNCTIDFRYEATRQKGYYLLSFNIKVQMNSDKSWLDMSKVKSDDMLAEILTHEQGHYTIAYMEQQELLRTVRKTVFYADYQLQAQNIFDRIDAKYRQLNIDYDTDTEHMVNREQQESWNAYFDKRLAYEPPAYAK